jgi:hypothetical protein
MTFALTSDETFRFTAQGVSFVGADGSGVAIPLAADAPRLEDIKLVEDDPIEEAAQELVRSKVKAEFAWGGDALGV